METVMQNRTAVANAEPVIAIVGADIRVSAAALPFEVFRALADHLTFPNPERRALERAGRYALHLPETVQAYWYDGDALVLPRGVGSMLRELLGDGLVVQDLTKTQTPVAVSFRGRLRSYQQRAVTAALRQRDGVIVGPPGCGKTAMGLAWVAARRQPALWVVPSIDILDQTAGEAEHFLGIKAGRIGAGAWEVGDVLTVATVQTLIRHVDKLAGLPFGAVVVDEAHHVPAATFFDVVSALPARFRLGLTATPERSDGLSRLLPAVMGPVVDTITQDDLEAAGVSVRPTLVWVLTDFTYYGDQTEYARLINALTTDRKRNELALALLEREARAGHVVLALTDRVQHAELLAAELSARGVTAAALVGNVKAAERQAILADFRAGKVSVVVATRLADEGLDVPELDRLFLLAPMRASGRVQQRLGRLMRALPDKEPVVFDFRDVNVGVLESQARSRWWSVYRHLVAAEHRIGGADLERQAG